jgi:hypothetical protein
MNMLNEDKMRLMTGIAMFEKREGKYISPANRYFRGDYISMHLLRSFFAFTVCYALCVAIWVLYNIDNLLNAMEIDDIIWDMKAGGVLYLAGLILYLIVTWIIYARRYEFARRGLNVYLTKLKRLSRRYELQGRTKEITKEGSIHDGASRN